MLNAMFIWNVRIEGGGHDEEVASSKKMNLRLECKNRYPKLFLTTMAAKGL